MKLLWHQPKICLVIRFLQRLLLFRHTSHVSDSLSTPRMSNNIFHERYSWRSCFNFSLVQVTLPHSHWKIERVRLFVCWWLVSVPCIPCSCTAHGILRLTKCFSHDQLVIPQYPRWYSWEYCKFKSPQNRNPFACWGWHCVVPGEISVSKAY